MNHTKTYHRDSRKVPPLRTSQLKQWSSMEGVWPLLQVIEKAQSFDTDKVVATWEKMQSIESIYEKARSVSTTWS